MATSSYSDTLEALTEYILFGGGATPASSRDPLDMASAERLYRDTAALINRYIVSREELASEEQYRDLQSRLRAAAQIQDHQARLREGTIAAYSDQLDYVQSMNELVTGELGQLSRDRSARDQRLLTEAEVAYLTEGGEDGGGDARTAAWDTATASILNPDFDSLISDTQLPGTVRELFSTYIYGTAGQDGLPEYISWEQNEDNELYGIMTFDESHPALATLDNRVKAQMITLVNRNNEIVAGRNDNYQSLMSAQNDIDLMQDRLDSGQTALTVDGFDAQASRVLDNIASGRQFTDDQLAIMEERLSPGQEELQLREDLDYFRRYIMGEGATASTNDQAETIRRLVESGWAEEAGFDVERMGQYTDTDGDGLIDSYAPGPLDRRAIRVAAWESRRPRGQYGITGSRSGRTGMAVQFNVRPEGDALVQLQNNDGEYSYTLVDGQPVLLSPGAAQQRISAASDASQNFFEDLFPSDSEASTGFTVSIPNLDGNDTFLMNQEEDGSFSVYRSDNVAEGDFNFTLLSQGPLPDWAVTSLSPGRATILSRMEDPEGALSATDMSKSRLLGDDRPATLATASQNFQNTNVPRTLTSSELPEGIQYGKTLIRVVGERLRAHASTILNYGEGALELADGTVYTPEQIEGDVVGVQVLDENSVYNRRGRGLFSIKAPLEQALMERAVVGRDPRSRVRSFFNIGITVHEAPKEIRQPASEVENEVAQRSVGAIGQSAVAALTNLRDRFRRPEPIDADIEPRITPPEEEAVAEPEPEEVPEEETVAEKTPMPKKAPVAEEAPEQGPTEYLPPGPSQRASAQERMATAQADIQQRFDDGDITVDQAQEELQAASLSIRDETGFQPGYSLQEMGVDLPEDSVEIPFSGAVGDVSEPPSRQELLSEALRERDDFSAFTDAADDLPQRFTDAADDLPQSFADDKDNFQEELNEYRTKVKMENMAEELQLVRDPLALDQPVVEEEEEEPRSERVQNFVRNLGSGQNLANMFRRRRPTVESDLSISPTEQEQEDDNLILDDLTLPEEENEDV